MTNEQNLFHQAFKAKGGVYLDIGPELDENFLYALLKSAKSQVRYAKLKEPRLPEIIIDLINKPKLGAGCTKVGDTYFIGVYFGTIELLFNHFNRILCSPESFTEIPYLDSKLVKLSSFPIEDSEELLKYEFCIPSSRERMDLAYYLTAHALSYVIDHEIGHISYGHVGLVCSGALLDKNDFHSMEMSADSFAVARAIRTIVDLRNSGVTTHAKIALYFGDFNRAIFYNLFAIYFLKRAMVWGMASSTHPDTKLRASIILNVGIQALIKIAQLNVEEGRKLLFDSFHAVEKAIGEITIKGYDDSYLPLLVDDDLYYKDVVLLLRTFNTLRPQLEKFKFTELPDKHEDV